MKNIFVWVADAKEYEDFVMEYTRKFAENGDEVGAHHLIPIKNPHDVYRINFAKDKVIRAGNYYKSPHFLEISIALQNAEGGYLNIARVAGWML